MLASARISAPSTERCRPLTSGTYPYAHAWAPDGSSILAFTAKETLDPADNEATLWSVDASGGGARPIRLVEHVDPAGLAVHPNGRSIAFMVRSSGTRCG